MFSIKIVLIQLKNCINRRGALKKLILLFGGCLVLLNWSLWSNSTSAFVPKYLRRYLRFPEGYQIQEKKLNDTELEKLIFKVEKLNIEAEVFNWRKHRSVTKATIIIAIQVHKDVERLQYLIISLGQVHFIRNVMLVFSHSYYDEEINALIRSIHFCKFMQIFYPHSLQLNPDKFPGVDPDDCNSSMPVGTVCFDRDARRTEHKQHWWWKAHVIFDGLDMPSKTRVVVFLEEDDYVLPDFLYMLRFARRALAYFPTAHVIALGRPYAVGLDYDALLIDRWTPLHDRGLAFNVSTWRKIAKKASLYCMYDDCSWSYSLVHLLGGFPGGVADVAACAAPRVVSLRAFASGAAGARWASGVVRRASVFPAAVRAVVTVGPMGRLRRGWTPPPHGNGGWADLRDQMLCLDPVTYTTTEVPTTTTNDLSKPYMFSRNTSKT